MRYDLAVVFDQQERLRDGSRLDDVRAADEAGVHSLWVGESWGWDAFSAMTLLAANTSHIRIGSGIVNVFSRSPAALAQHFASIDQISGGRVIIGLGSSGPNVTEHFHGVPYRRPLRRMREYVEIINTLMAGEPLHYEGQLFSLRRGFKLRFQPVREHIPVFIASLLPASVTQTAEIADGWLPTWIPVEDLPKAVRELRDAAAAAGRDPSSLSVRSPGTIVLAKDVEGERVATAAKFAFYISRMGRFYYEHIRRLGYGNVAQAVRRAWEQGGSDAGGMAAPEEFLQSMSLVTESVAEARDRMAQQAEAGVDLHCVSVEADSARELRRIYEALIG